MSRLAPHFRELHDRLTVGSAAGTVPTGVPGVQFFWVTESVPRAPLLYSPGIVIIGQGHTVGYLGDRVFRYDEDTYLVLGVPLPFECETHPAADGPLLGLRIDVDIAALHGLVANLGAKPDRGSDAAPPNGLEPVQMSGDMLEATIRLLKCLRDPMDSKVLGSATVNEVIYRVLRGEQGRVLYSLTRHSTPDAAVARARSHAWRLSRGPQRGAAGRGERHERVVLPPRLQARHRRFAAAVPEEDQAGQGQGPARPRGPAGERRGL